jgi:SAM domain (Sterile alpha motif)
MRRGSVAPNRGKGATQQITDWLKKLGMSEYRERFVENDVDISVLPLTDQDLKDLGVSLGHRRKILAAIAELSAGGIPTLVQPVVTEKARWLPNRRRTDPQSRPALLPAI